MGRGTLGVQLTQRGKQAEAEMQGILL